MDARDEKLRQEAASCQVQITGLELLGIKSDTGMPCTKEQHHGAATSHGTATVSSKDEDGSVSFKEIFLPSSMVPRQAARQQQSTGHISHHLSFSSIGEDDSVSFEEDFNHVFKEARNMATTVDYGYGKRRSSLGSFYANDSIARFRQRTNNRRRSLGGHVNDSSDPCHDQRRSSIGTVGTIASYANDSIARYQNTATEKRRGSLGSYDSDSIESFHGHQRRSSIGTIGSYANDSIARYRMLPSRRNRRGSLGSYTIDSLPSFANDSMDVARLRMTRGDVSKIPSFHLSMSSICSDPKFLDQPILPVESRRPPTHAVDSKSRTVYNAAVNGGISRAA